MKKKVLIYSLGGLALAFCLWACDDDLEMASGITVDKESVSIIIGNKTQITVGNTPEGSSLDTREIQWKSKNEEIATITQFGILTGVEEGNTEIEVTWNGNTKTIPVTVTDPIQLPATRNGSWLFDDASNLVKAEVGNPLIYGQRTSDTRITVVPTTDLSGFSAIPGPSVPSGNGAVRVKKWWFFSAAHGIAPNGGGEKVNEYTIMMDIRFAESAGGWKTLFQTDITNNDDGEVFINGRNMGVGATGYSEGDLITYDTWHRIVISVKLGERIQYFLDGTLIRTFDNTASDNLFKDVSRFAINPTCIFVGDNDGDDGEIDVAEIAMWDIAFDAAQVKKLERLMNKR
ncbi:Ig-like domain-containing protein [Parapedobacter sp. DT-150]|uniref:Ig-like domain-containing protein n=1 Tax=Parapedobacter sp. DT-150 TaxID=3396162 RepID=UPI003F1D657B